MRPSRSIPTLAFLLCTVAACAERPTLEAAREAPPSPSAPVPPEDQLPNARTSLIGKRPLGPMAANKRLGPLGTEGEALHPAEDSSAALTSSQLAAKTAHDGLDFLGRPDKDILERLRSSEVASASKGTSGRSLAFKVELASGGQAYFKPEQKLPTASWSAEVAAYHLDRALELGRVPPIAARRLAWDSFSAAATGDPRAQTVVRDRDGSVRGALIHWLPNKLVPAQTPPGWESWLGHDAFAPTRISPYQRPAAYRDARKVEAARAKRGEPARVFYASVPDPNRPELPAELSDMIVFDYLTANADRFGEDNANVLTLGAYGPLVFLDNGAAFAKNAPERELMNSRLAPVSRFRKRTIDALRKLDVQALGKRMEADALGPFLDRAALQALETRRQAVLQHVAKQQQRFAEATLQW